jgi:orotidine-5'-phosphate decarboxylase
MTADASRSLCVALDVPTVAEAYALASQLNGVAGVLKVGLELFCAQGPSVVAAVKAAAPASDIFLDLKLHDIPHTVARATTSVRGLGVRFLTIHASGGSSMMRAAVEAAGDDVTIVAVTMLTALSNDDVRAVGFADDAGATASRLAVLAQHSGVRALVCSPLELSAIRGVVGRDMHIITPGIRAHDAPADDQQRTATPADAMRMGSNMLVVGRPITRATDVRASAVSFLAAMSAPHTNQGAL